MTVAEIFQIKKKKKYSVWQLPINGTGEIGKEMRQSPLDDDIGLDLESLDSASFGFGSLRVASSSSDESQRFHQGRRSSFLLARDERRVNFSHLKNE